MYPRLCHCTHSLEFIHFIHCPRHVVAELHVHVRDLVSTYMYSVQCTYMYMYVHVLVECMCVHVQVAEDEEQSESSESEPGSPGIDPLVFSREDFDTGTVQYCTQCR